MEHQNTLYTNDNLLVLHGMESESVDLIYLDPPFNTKKMQKGKTKDLSFKDMWSLDDIDEHFSYQLKCDYPHLYQYIAMTKNLHSKAMFSYCMFMALRLLELHRVLKSTGSIYLHCNQSISHYLKNIMDSIFGKNNFRNEVAWYYTNKLPDKRKKLFTQSMDTILFYVKNVEENFTFHLQEEKRDKSVKDRRIKKINGKKVTVRGEDGKPIYDIYTHRTVDNVWKIPMLTGKNKERTGYATQKPLKLLDRIIKASSNKGDLILDPFCGCATACVSAEKLERKWIGIDDKEYAAEAVAERLKDQTHRDLGRSVDSLYKDFKRYTEPPKRKDDLEWINKSHHTVRKRLYGEQEGYCANPECNKHLRAAEFHIDHIIPKSKGGGDYYENYQLLCMVCNTRKGNKPMPWLIQHKKALKKHLEGVTYTRKPRKR